MAPDRAQNETLTLGVNDVGEYLTGEKALPDCVKYLFIHDVEIEALPQLPRSLVALYCEDNRICELPPLPPTLKYLKCDRNLLRELPELPSGLVSLKCECNSIEELPSLPPSLQELHCRYNMLGLLPDLPPALRIVDCAHNRIESLPTLPRSLVTLWCDNNLICELPPLPDSITLLYCSDNLLSCLPIFPASLETLNGYSRPFIVNCAHGNSAEKAMQLAAAAIEEAKSLLDAGAIAGDLLHGALAALLEADAANTIARWHMLHAELPSAIGLMTEEGRRRVQETLLYTKESQSHCAL